jgi:hypothetical protein
VLSQRNEIKAANTRNHECKKPNFRFKAIKTDKDIKQ